MASGEVIPIGLTFDRKVKEPEILAEMESLGIRGVADYEQSLEVEIVFPGGRVRTYKWQVVGGTISERPATPAEERFAVKVRRLFAEKALRRR